MNSHDVDTHIINAEVRIKVLEEIIARVDRRLINLEDKIDAQFQWTIGLVFVSILIPVVLHYLTLT